MGRNRAVEVSNLLDYGEETQRSTRTHKTPVLPYKLRRSDLAVARSRPFGALRLWSGELAYQEYSRHLASNGALDA